MKRFLILALCLCLTACSALADMEVHFLSVGNADAAVIAADGHVLLIDGGKSGSSQLIYSYLQNTLHTAHIDAVIATHPHADHIGGLPAAFNACTVERVYSSVPMDGEDGAPACDTREFRSLVKYARKQGLDFILPERGERLQLDGLTVEFLSGGYTGDLSALDSSGVNNLSLIVRVSYGSVSFLFTGDAEWEGEQAALHDGGDSLRATVLKVAHHGSGTSSGMEFLQAVAPRFAVISCDEDAGYGHPSAETLARLQSLSVPVYRLDRCGTLICRTDGEALSFSAPLPEALPGEADKEPPSSAAYIGNRNSKRFHVPDCASVAAMKEKNRVELSSREEALDKGYKPCGNCHP